MQFPNTSEFTESKKTSTIVYSCSLTFIVYIIFIDFFMDVFLLALHDQLPSFLKLLSLILFFLFICYLYIYIRS